MQIPLHQISLPRVVLHQVCHLQQPSVSCAYIIYTGVVVLTLHSPDGTHDVLRLGILSQSSRGSGVHARNVDDGLLRRVQHLVDVVQVVATIEVIAQHQVFQILVAIQLLIVVVSHGIEPRLILLPQHGDAVTSEVRARHGDNMARRVVHHPSDHIAQIRRCIGTCVVKLVNRQQHIVKAVIREFLHAVAQRGMGTHQHLRCILSKELQEASLLVPLVLHVAQVIVGRHPPVGKEAMLPQVRVLERASDALFGHRHHHLLHSLMRQLVQRDEHQRTALARCRWCLNQQKPFVACLVCLGLHLAHAQIIRCRCLSRLFVANIHDIVAGLLITYFFHRC